MLGLDKSKFLLIILIFSITGNLLLLLQIKAVENTLLACQIDKEKLVRVVEVNNRTTSLQTQRIEQLQHLVKAQNVNVDKQITSVMALPDQKNCIAAINQGLQELHKH